MKKVSLLLTVLLLCGIIHAQEITLEHVTNSWYDGGTDRLFPNCETTFFIRFNNNTDVKHGGFTTGFKLWTTIPPERPVVVTGDTLDIGIPWAERFTIGAHIDESGCDGVYPEIIGFSGAGFPAAPGIEAGFDYTAVTVTATAAAEGGTLCIDSSFFGAVGFWVWGTGYKPSWDGPHCFQSMQPGCMGPLYTDIPDTIFVSSCSTATHLFTFSFGCYGNPLLLEGPGTLEIYPNGFGVDDTARWTWSFPELPENQTITVAMESFLTNCGDPYDLYTIPIAYGTVLPIDPCIELVYQPDTISFYNLNTYRLHFQGQSNCDPNSSYRYNLESGPGLIDIESGEWEYTPTIDDTLKIDTLTISVIQNCSERKLFTMIINHAFSSAYFAGDVNIDGRKDISDLLYLVDYFFKQPPGPAPPEPMFADCNNSGLLDISDLLMMVDYYFGTGEPCSLE